MTDYILSDSALADLEDIAEYFLAVRPEYLEELQVKLEAKFQFVGRHPYAGVDSGRLLEGLRRVIVRDYVIYYRFTAGRTVISRVLHGSRDIDAAYFDGSNP